MQFKGEVLAQYAQGPGSVFSTTKYYCYVYYYYQIKTPTVNF